MPTDWKDALAALNNSGVIPQTDDSDPKAPEPENKTVNTDTLHIVYEKKGRKGKPATIIEGFTCSDQKVDDIARRLKTSLATGGSSRGGEILLQGDCREKAGNLLRQMGFKTK